MSLLRCSGFVLCAALPAYGQQQDAAENTRIESIEVLGSHIRRPEVEGALPLQVITRDDIARSGAISAADVVSRVSANLIGRTDVPYNTSVGYTQAGLASANLRGLGEGSTLVMLNGHRLANYAANGGTVDLNFIPVAAIERVEVLKDGASALYGSDAIAGVINFVLRKEFKGAQLAVHVAQAQHGGGGQKQATLTMGYGDLAVDGFNVFAVGNYQKDDVLRARDRPYSRTGYRPEEGADNTNLETFPANIRGATLLNPGFGSGCSPPVTIPIPGTLRCGHDTLAVINLIPLVERSNALGGMTWRFGADNEVFAQYLYSGNRYVVTRNQAPSSETFNPDRRPILYPVGGPFYPTDFAAANRLTGDLTLLYRAVPLGPITDDVRSDAQHVVLGVRGSRWAWAYDIAWTHSDNTQELFGANGRVSARRLIAAMASGLINPFGPSGPEGEALLASTEVTGEVFHDKASTDGLEIIASREIYQLAGGPLLLAMGADARRERLSISFSPEQSSGDVIGSIIANSSSGSRSVEALFAELNIPLGKKVEARLAARYDQYSDFGTTINPKLAVRWQPTTWFLLRSSYGTGFRAPTIPDLYAPLSSNFTRIRYSDPLRCPTTHSISDCDTSFPILNGGNPALQPEQSNQFNFGAVWQIGSQSSVSLDYWRINKTQVVGALTDTTLFNNFAQFSNTNFVRGAVDPTFPTLPGPIESLFAGKQNFGKLRTSGLDIDFVYRVHTNLGRFSVHLNGTYVAQWRQQLDGVNYASGVGRNAVGEAIPRWRHYATVHWSLGPWSATLAESFSSGYIDEKLSGSSLERRVGTNDVWDVQGTYTGLRYATITFGLKNLFDRAPPFSNQSTFGQVMYDPRYADPRGRVLYANLIVTF